MHAYLLIKVERTPLFHFEMQRPVQEVLPKAGLVVSEKGNLSEILCKPKIMPLKSITLQKLEEMEVCTHIYQPCRRFTPFRVHRMCNSSAWTYGQLHACTYPAFGSLGYLLSHRGPV
jgi:Cilia BBSome complex subunit 10